jgi:two-component system phosphate regulon response regulator PhoB
MQKATILVVDDEEDILELVSYNLQKEGYQVLAAETGEEALHTAREDLPELIVLDLMLPGLDGLEVCKILKNSPDTKHIPIIMLTAKGSESDVVVGLELGADDYITKPFSPRILLARVKTALRRKQAQTGGDEKAVIEHSGLLIFPDRHEVLVEGESIDLTATEFRILEYMAQHPGRVFSRDQIVDAARGKDYPVTDRSVDVHIVSLRKKLGPAGRYIDTVRGVGYRFRE